VLVMIGLCVSLLRALRSDRPPAVEVAQVPAERVPMGTS
jgi:hypothetical protein